jgi:hypothetical protein
MLLPSRARDLGRSSLFSVSQALSARASSTGSVQVDSLPEDVSGRASGFEIVAFVEGLAEEVDLGVLGGGA